ncbi:MAG: class I SAM-dependent RNA methyltransferase [Lachnospiraceae bacterium]|nr:class I SAM-dependent RNA methyltransferase [Lachnospiraceae bacterium]
MLKKNDVIEMEITDTGSEGEGIGRADGMAFFVMGAIPGDIIKAGVMKLKKTYGYARLIEIITPSPSRVTPRCRVAALCGGCQLQHESYEAQLKFKTEKVLNCLTRIGGLVKTGGTADGSGMAGDNGKEAYKTAKYEILKDPVTAETHEISKDPVTSDTPIYEILKDPETSETAVMYETAGAREQFGYRNKSQYPVGKDKNGRNVAGFYRNHSHDIIACTECAIAHPVAGSIMDAVLEYMERTGVSAYDETAGVMNKPEKNGKADSRAKFESTKAERAKDECAKAESVGIKETKIEGSRTAKDALGNKRGIIRHVLIRTGRETGQVMVCLVICAEDIPQKDLLKELLGGAAAKHGMKLESVSCCVNYDQTNVIMTDKIKLLWGSDHIVDKIGDISYRISPLSFFQVNPLQTRVLYSKVAQLVEESIKEKDDRRKRYDSAQTGAEEKETDTEVKKYGKPVIWDMYCGTGSISLALCGVAEKVYGVEIIETAVDDACENARMNGITNAEFFCGPAEEVVPRMYEKDPAYGADIVVVDPPRKGCDEKLLNCLVQMAPSDIIYVSCDPATLARDIKILREGGYTIKKVMPVDMFPQTVHVETVCLLSKLSEAKHHIEVKVDMDELDLTSAEAKATYKEI